MSNASVQARTEGGRNQLQTQKLQGSYLDRFRDEYLIRHRDFGKDAVKNNYQQIRKLFRYIKHGDLDQPLNVTVTRDDILSLSRNDVYRYFIALRDTGFKKGTGVSHLASFRHFQTWTCSDEFLDLREPIYTKGKILDVVNSMSRKQDPGHTLSYAEVQQLLAEARQLTFDPVIKHAMILTLVKTGLRRCELVRIRLHDVDWDKQFIHVSDRKNEHQTDVLFDSEVASVLKQYLKTRNGVTANSPLFSHSGGQPYSPNTLTDKLGDRLNRNVSVDVKGPHDFRHTFSNHYTFEVGGTQPGRDLFLDVQMAHHEQSTRRHYQTDHRATRATLAQRRQDYNRAVPQYLMGDCSLQQFLN